MTEKTRSISARDAKNASPLHIEQHNEHKSGKKHNYDLSETADSADSADSAVGNGSVNSVDEVDFESLSNGQALIPGMGRRMLAYLIDYVTVFFLGLGTHMLILWSFTRTPIAARLGNLYVLAFIVLAINAAYHIFLESHPKLRATLGKLICRLQVVDIDANALSLWQAKIRFLWRLPSILFLGIPYLLAGRGHYGLTLHDMKALTVVTTRGMNDLRVQSGLACGRKLNKSDKACLVLTALFLGLVFYIVLKYALRFL